MQNVVGPTLVAMATKFALGADMQTPYQLVYLKISQQIYLMNTMLSFWLSFLTRAGCIQDQIGRRLTLNGTSPIQFQVSGWRSSR